MQVRLSVTSQIDLAADAAALRSLPDGLADSLAQTAADYGTPAVLLAATARRGTLSMGRNKLASRLDALPVVRPGDKHAEAEIVAVPRGAWHLVEYGADAHEISNKRRYGRRTASHGMPTPYGVFSKVNHPGTAGTAVWEGAMADAEPVIDDAVQAAFDDAVRAAIPGAEG